MRKSYEKIIILLSIVFMGGLNTISMFAFTGVVAGIYEVAFFILAFLSIPVLLTFRIKNLSYVYKFLIFLAIVTFSFIINHKTIASQYKYYLFVTNVVFITYLFSQLDVEILRRNVLKYLYWLAVVQIVYLFIAYSSMNYSIEQYRWALITQMHVSIILISRVLGFGVLYIALNRLNIVSIILSALMFSAMLFLNEMGPLIALMIALSLVFAKHNRVPKVFSYLLFLIIFILTSNFVIDLKYSNLLNDPRFVIYDNHLQLFIRNPIMGAGIAGYYEITGRFQSAHNIFLEVLSEFGILGISSFLLLFVTQIRLALHGLKEKDSSYAIAFIYITICVQFSGNISLNPFFWFLGMIVYRIYNPFLKASFNKTRMFANGLELPG
jgi:O-antigen ligase